MGGLEGLMDSSCTLRMGPFKSMDESLEVSASAVGCPATTIAVLVE